MKSTSTLLALVAALILTGINRSVAQEVTESNSTTPALMLTFTGSNQGETANLVWEMENETDSKWFVVERAGAEGGFDSIAVILGINGGGNVTTYNFTDPSMLNGTNSYRLREVDMNGVERYSKIVTLYNGQTTAKMDVYPNPAIATLSFSITSPSTQPVLVQVYSMAGVMMNANEVEVNAGVNTQSVAINNLKAGNYILKVSSQNGSFQYVQSFVKLN